MFDYSLTDSIIACSSGSSSAAISLIRISTNKPIDHFDCINFRSQKIENRKSYLVDLIFNDEIYDEALVTYFKGPNSFTGQNVIEFSVHGNPLNVNRILEAFTKTFDIRLAGPGEFSYRALKNGKLNVSQVEGLDLLLNSRSSLIFSSGLKLLKGDLNEEFIELKNSFLKLKTSVELNIDFAEDIGEDQSEVLFKNNFQVFFKRVSKLKSSIASSADLISPKVVLFGETNAGKSTLFNQLVGKNRSIVSDIEGTTRDYVSEEILIDGQVFTFIDTAGIRETNEVIESIGIERSINMLSKAFFKILVVDLNNFSNLDYKYDFDLIVVTHIDEAGPMGANNESIFGSIGAKFHSSIGSIGANLLKDDISSNINDLVISKYRKSMENSPIVVPRYIDSITHIYKHSKSIDNLLMEKYDIGIIDNGLHQISKYVNDLLGEFSSEDILNEIFHNFCIGK